MKHVWKDVQLGVDQGFPKVSEHVVILAWTHVIPAHCTHSYEFNYHVNPAPYNHVTICSCTTYAHVHVHAHVKCPPQSTIITFAISCLSPWFHTHHLPRVSPTISTHHVHLWSPTLPRLFPLSFYHMFVLGENLWHVTLFLLNFVFFQTWSLRNGRAMTDPNKSFVVYRLCEILIGYMTMNDIFVYNPLSLL